jgi:tRNA pseudouridine38-40 synthase
MTRFRLLVEYDGGPYVGWQRQENGASIQRALEEAVFAFCGERVTTVGAGRTDAGVHALGQVVHLDIARACSAATLRDAVNFHLKPQPIAVLAAAVASPDFHARFSAIGRRYLYRILNRRAPPVLERGRAWWVPVPLDTAAMQEAAQRLVGRHDFTSFRSSICQAASPLKTLDRLEVEQQGEEIRIHAAARSFLHHQVRNMAGSLKLVGEGRWSADDIAAALAARDRRAAGPTAPPEGLFLMEVRYPP